MYNIDYNSYRSIKGFNRRERFLVLHYTAVDFATSIELLSGNGGVSAHYLVPDPTDKTYLEAGFKDMRIFNLVDEQERAWHAGVSSWADRSNLNDTAIGIEIVNLANDDGNGNFEFPLFKKEQIEAVKQLALSIIQRYPDIQPTHIVAHSDISVGRKSDPGAAFPWKELYDAGIGAWYENDTKEKYEKYFKEYGSTSKKDILSKLKTYGYSIDEAHTDQGFNSLIRAFQLHFRPSKYDGVADIETVAILYALVEKYFS